MPICEQLYDPNDADKLTELGTIYGQHGDLRSGPQAVAPGSGVVSAIATDAVQPGLDLLPTESV